MKFEIEQSSSESMDISGGTPDISLSADLPDNLLQSNMMDLRDKLARVEAESEKRREMLDRLQIENDELKTQLKTTVSKDSQGRSGKGGSIRKVSRLKEENERLVKEQDRLRRRYEG